MDSKHGSSGDPVPMIILARLTAAQGFVDFASVLALASELQNEGIDAICERAPGALMDTPDAYYLKVPVLDQAKAEQLLADLLSR